jgi:hypothetical protein
LSVNLISAAGLSWLCGLCGFCGLYGLDCGSGERAAMGWGPHVIHGW